MKTRVVFIGSVNFSAAILKNIIHTEMDIVAIITKQQSKFNSDFYDLSSIAKQNKIPYKYVKNINDADNISWIKNFSPDIIFCFGFSQIISSKILEIPSMGVLGYHPAELPKNRGRHPIIWALVLGLKRTASTFFFMDEGADTGDILSQYKINISKNDNAEILYNRIIEVAMKQVDEFVPYLISRNYTREKQDHLQASSWRKRVEADGIIDWRMSSMAIYNLVRGLTKPYIGAHFYFEGEKVRVWDTEIVDQGENNIEPGKVISISSKGVVVKVGEGAIRLKETEPELKIQQGIYL